MADWKKIKTEYIRGNTSYRKLAEKYGVSFGTLRKVAAREKWTDLRSIAASKRDTLMAESVGEREAKNNDMVQSLADKLLKFISEGIDEGNLVKNARDLRLVTSSLADLKDIKGWKSELDMQEQMARIEKLRRDATSEEESKDIRVVICEDLDEYAK